MTAAVPLAVTIASDVLAALGILSQVVTPATLAQIQTLIRGERPDLLPAPPDDPEATIEGEGEGEIEKKFPETPLEGGMYRTPPFPAGTKTEAGGV